MENLNKFLSDLINGSKKTKPAYPDSTNPLLLKIRKKYPQVFQDIFDLTTHNIKQRQNILFRNRIRSYIEDKIIPHISQIKGNLPQFIYRKCRQSDGTIPLNIGESYTIKDGFMSFSNGAKAIGISNTTNTIMVSFNLTNVYVIGDISQIPSEKEVLVPEGITFTVTHFFENLDSVANSPDSLTFPECFQNTIRSWVESPHAGKLKESQFVFIN